MSGRGGYELVRPGANPPGDPDSLYIIKITGAMTDAGKYTCNYGKLPSRAALSAAGDLAESHLGTFLKTGKAYNLMEVGFATHDLTDVHNTKQIYFLGKLLGKDADGDNVFAINGFFTAC